MAIPSMQDFALDGQRVLIRQDLNVPVKDGKVTSDARIKASIPTIKAALEAGAAVMVMSHLGRPEEGKYEEEDNGDSPSKTLRSTTGKSSSCSSSSCSSSSRSGVFSELATTTSV